MDLFNKEEVVAPSMEAAVAQAVAPSAPAKSAVECTRDSDCPVNDCENCS